MKEMLGHLAFGKMEGNRGTPAGEPNNFPPTAEMYSNKVPFTRIQIKSLLQVKPI